MSEMPNKLTTEEFKAVLNHYGVVVTNKKNYLCPFHEDRTPSMSVDPQKTVFCCHGCGKGGDAYTFVALKENLDVKNDFKNILIMVEKILGKRERKLLATYEYIFDGKIVNRKFKYSSDPKYIWDFSKKQNGIFPIYNFDCIKEF